MHHGPIPSSVALAVATAPLISESARSRTSQKQKTSSWRFIRKLFNTPETCASEQQNPYGVLPSYFWESEEGKKRKVATRCDVTVRDALGSGETFVRCSTSSLFSRCWIFFVHCIVYLPAIYPPRRSTMYFSSACRQTSPPTP